MTFDRRTALRLAASSWGLRAFATGLPLRFILDPGQAASAPRDVPTYLVLAVSDRGDPVNANAPGSFVDGVTNNPFEAMAETPLELGSVITSAARPWSQLSAELRSRMAFLHMSTGVVTHTQMDEVLQLRGAVAGPDGSRNEMLPSMLAAEAQPGTGSLLGDPIPLGPEGLSAGGLPLDGISPQELKNLFSGSNPGLAELADLRDQTLDSLYGELRSSGTGQQRTFLDRFVQSRDQARQLGEQLGDLLERVSETPFNIELETQDQILAAVALLRLNVTPVVTIRLPFGGDNHQDGDLSDEADDHEVGVGALQSLWDELAAAGIEDRTTFAMLNVFGRTLRPNQAGGRDHNGDHHVLVAFGPEVKSGVYGGLVPQGETLSAAAIDPATGLAAPHGAVAPEVSLLAAAHTLVDWMGLPRDVASRRLSGGQPLAGLVR